MDEFDHLAHYGVPGMKWGIRKVQATGNFWKDRVAKKAQLNKQSFGTPVEKRMSKRKSEKLSAQREKEWARLYRGRARMNNAELRRALDRLQMENQLAQQVKQASELTKDPESRSKRFIRQMRKTAVIGSKISGPVIDALISQHDGSTASGKAAIDELLKRKKLIQSVGNVLK